MSSTNVIPFGSWVIQPGNHRLLLQIKNKLSPFLQKDIEIKSWQDVYELFEESFNKNEKSKALFQPIFNAQPPSAKTGASQSQIRLYRGAFVDPDALTQPDPTKDKTITYRGRQIVVKAKPTDSANSAAEKPKTTSARYYRGVKIDS